MEDSWHGKINHKKQKTDTWIRPYHGTDSTDTMRFRDGRLTGCLLYVSSSICAGSQQGGHCSSISSGRLWRHSGGDGGGADTSVNAVACNSGSCQDSIPIGEFRLSSGPSASGCLWQAWPFLLHRDMQLTERPVSDGQRFLAAHSDNILLRHRPLPYLRADDVVQLLPVGTLAAWAAPHKTHLPAAFNNIHIDKGCETMCYMHANVCPMQLPPYDAL